MLSNRLGLPISATSAIGDGHSDLDMLLVAGTSFAVENAVEDVLKAVDIVVATNDKDGVAEACELISTAIRGDATRQPLSK